MDEQPLKPDSLVSIMLKSADGWDQVAAFVTLTMRCKMEIVRERQSRSIAATTQQPVPDVAIPSVFAINNPATEEKEDNPGWSYLGYPLAAKIPAKPRILNKGRV